MVRIATLIILVVALSSFASANTLLRGRMVVLPHALCTKPVPLGIEGNFGRERPSLYSPSAAVRGKPIPVFDTRGGKRKSVPYSSLKVGMRVLAKTTGLVRESYPAGVDVVWIEIVK